MRIVFAKYQGAANDFVLVDDRANSFPVSCIESLCDRRRGIGADGVLLLQQSTTGEADFRMRVFNADGSEPEMCGNGLRCLIQYLSSLGEKLPSYRIETLAGIQLCTAREDLVTTLVSKAEFITKKGTLEMQGETLSYDLIDTGVPHVVLFVSDLESIDVVGRGKAIRWLSSFQPHGVNVNFARVSGNALSLRTYERGVEGETLACGTGSIAAALAARETFSLQFPVKVETRSRETLEVGMDRKQIYISGPARFVFKGEITI